MENNEKPTVLLIDISALYHAAWHVVAETDSISKVQDITIAGVRQCSGMVGSDALVAICCDDRKSWRRDLYVEYKAQREKKPASFYGLFDGTIEKLKAEGYLCWRAEGFEADDVIATAHDAALALGHDVVIASHDKDLCQLAGDHTKVLRTHDWVLIDTDVVSEKFGVAPRQIGDWLALTGDTSDNVPGCKGVGKKTATELLQTYGSLDRIFDAVIARSADGAFLKNDDGTYAHNAATVMEPFWKSNKAVRANLVACMDVVMLSRRLVGLAVNAPIRFEDIYDERRPTVTASANYNLDDVDDFGEDTANVINRAFSPGNVPPIEKGSATVENETKAANEPSQTVVTPAKAESPASDTPDPTVNTGVLPVTTDAGHGIVPHVDTIVEPRALVVAEFTKQLEPTSPGGAMKMAKILHESRLFSKYSTEEQIFAAMARGRAMGYCGVEALDMFWPMDAGQGKQLAPKAHLVIHLAESHPDCEYFIMTESTMTQCTYVARRKSWPQGREVSYTYSIEEAVQAGITTLELAPKPVGKSGEKVRDDRNPWQKNRRAMLQKTCATLLTRVVFPGAGLGLATYEELGGND